MVQTRKAKKEAATAATLDDDDQVENDGARLLLPFLVLVLGVMAAALRAENEAHHLLLLCALSLASYGAVLRLVPRVGALCAKAGLPGTHMAKPATSRTATTPIPEALGMVTGVVYLVCVIMFQPFFGYMLGAYNAALTSIAFMLLLGFADDVLDLRWSVKIFLSAIASLPLLVGYYGGGGATSVVVPLPLRAALQMRTLELGVLYHAYMGAFAVFCTNSINIYAGINGLEVGQSCVIACAILAHNALELTWGAAVDDALTRSHHLLSVYLIVPFLATSLALARFNAYPSRVFVGDSYTYFAGMTLAVAGILGHFSKTLTLFFVPQLLNFALSLPQLLRLVPCPRHRVPRLNAASGRLESSGNLTLINAALVVVGPLHERTLVRWLLAFQSASCAAALVVRHYLSTFVY